MLSNPRLRRRDTSSTPPRLGGFCGALGGMLMAKFAGRVLESIGTYTPIFVVASTAYLAALLVVHLLARDYSPAFAETAAKT